MTLLTDTEQKKLLAELYNTTRTKIETVLKKYRLDKVPDEVEALRKEQVKQRSKGRSLWQALWAGLGTVKKQGDELFKD
jgi:hypothetical protein